MKKFIFISFILSPSVVLAQTSVGPEGYKLLWITGIVILSLGIVLFFSRMSKKQKSHPKKFLRFRRKKLALELTKDRLIRPKTLTLTVKNTGSRFVDIEAPVLIFRKLWSKRKFKLKRINNREVYPLYLEAGKTHTVMIDLNRFFEHDKKLKRFYRGQIILQDVEGKTFRSKRVSLRKSLYS